MASLSLCMITKDEESHLKQCLDLAKDFVDEIVIVDTGSSDKTKEIAKQFTSKVIDLKWPNDFSKARNESLKYASKDWIIYIDADEVIDTKDWKKIRELIDSDKVEGYLLYQRNYTFDKTAFGWKANDNYEQCKGTGFFVSPIVRLFRNKKDYSFCYKVHETVDKSIISNKGVVKDSKIPIHHYGYLKEEDFIELKRDKYLKLGLDQIKSTPDNPRPYYEVAVIYKNSGKLKEAEKYLKKTVELNPNYKLVFTNLGEVYTKQEKFKEAIESYKESINRKKDENAYINLGMISYKFGNLEEPVKLLEKALQINPNNPVAYNNLGLVLVKAKKFRAALSVFEKAFEKTRLEKFKQALDAMKKRFAGPLKIEELLKTEKYDELEKYLRERVKKNPTDLIAYTHLGRLFVKLDKKKKLIKSLQEAVKHNKSKDSLCINLYTNLANLLIEAKNFEKAETVVKSALEIDSENDFLKGKLEFIQKNV